MRTIRLAFFLTLLTITLLMAVRLAPAADLTISIPVQLTHAQNFDPSPSPDGKKLVFISMLSGKEQLFTMDADGKNIAQLTRDDADHEDPAWSPDGKKIAFVMITKERTSIAVMNADGSNVDVLTPKEHSTIHPNWSADSKHVMYCTNDDVAPPKKNEAQINVVDLATKKITPVITGGINTYGSWSPDRKQIAFRKIIGEENSEVFLANADGSNQRNLRTIRSLTAGRGGRPVAARSRSHRIRPDPATKFS